MDLLSIIRGPVGDIALSLALAYAMWRVWKSGKPANLAAGFRRSRQIPPDPQ